MITKCASTIDELLGIINELHIALGHQLWYRGVANAEWELIPSVQRDQKRLQNEQCITNDFYIKAKRVMDRAPEKTNYAAWMSIMQHYGLPTRLLDWSASPLIAAFFAVEQLEQFPQTDACIWILTPGLLNEREGFGSYLYPADAYTVQSMLVSAFKDNAPPEFDDRILACHSTVNNLRMNSQQARFTIHNSLRKLADIDDENLLHKIVIPNWARKQIRYALEVFGITESFIYPDLDHISKDLKRQYGIQ